MRWDLWLLALWWLAMLAATHLPLRLPPRQQGVPWDKLFHLGSYGVLTALVAEVLLRSLEQGRRRGPPADSPSALQPGPHSGGSRAWNGRGTWLVTSGGHLKRGSLLLIAVAIVGLYAMLDEVTQPLVGRQADMADLLADAVGASLGGLSWLAWRRGSRRA